MEAVLYYSCRAALVSRKSRLEAYRGEQTWGRGARTLDV